MNRGSDILYAMTRLKGWSIAAGLLLVSNIALYSAGLAPLRASISGLEDRLTAARDQRLQEQAVKQARGHLDQFQKLLSDPQDFVRIMSALSKAAKQEGLGTPSLKYNPVSRIAQGLSKIDADMNVNGSYPQIKKFLAFLETQDRLIALDEIGFSTTHDGKKVGADLSIKVYLHEGKPS